MTVDLNRGPTHVAAAIASQLSPYSGDEADLCVGGDPQTAADQEQQDTSGEPGSSKPLRPGRNRPVGIDR